MDDRNDLGEHFDRPRRQAMAKLAARQHGVVAFWQLRRLGYRASTIRSMAETAHLHRIYRGVYAVGHRRLPASGRRMAAVLACGPEAVLSHGSAAAHWELRPVPNGPIDVTVPGRSRRGQAGIRVHNVRNLRDEDRARFDGVPITSVARTILDYAEVAARQKVRLAIEAGERMDLLYHAELETLINVSPGRHGINVIRGLLAEMRGPAPWTLSELERRFLALIRDAGLPEPQANVLVGGELVDFYWPGPKLVVELDGYRFHKSREQFEKDRRRDAKLQLLGIRVVRLTQRRLELEPEEVIRELLELLRDDAA